jgi:hypothetical protein
VGSDVERGPHPWKLGPLSWSGRLRRKFEPVNRRLRAALRGIGAASDISETNSVDLSCPRDVPIAGRAPVSQNIQPAASLIGRRPLMIAERGNEMVDLIQCLSGTQANNSGWPVFSGRYVEYPCFRKEWWAYPRMYMCT